MNFVKLSPSDVGADRGSPATKQKVRGKSADGDHLVGMSDDDDKATGAESTGMDGKKITRADIAAIARCATESIRMARETAAMVFLTFIIPICSVSDAVNQAGTDYQALVKAKKSKAPPHAYKWCYMICALVDATKVFIETKGEFPRKADLQQAHSVLTQHRDSVKDGIGSLDASQLHCSSRTKYEGDKCIICVGGASFPEEIKALRIIVQVVYDTKACEGPAPPTKAERGARKVLSKLAPVKKEE